MNCNHCGTALPEGAAVCTVCGTAVQTVPAKAPVKERTGLGILGAFIGSVLEVTGAALKLIAPLPEGDVLAVCTDPAQLKVAVIHADGTEENGFGLLDPQTSLTGFVLKPGINRIRYQSAEGTAKTRVLLEWDNCYEGV